MSITMTPKAPRGGLNKKATPKSKAAAERLNQTLVAGEDGPPSETSMTLPNGIAALDRHTRAAAAGEKTTQPQAQPPEQVELGPVIQLRLDWLARHPANRQPREDDIAARAASLDSEGQLEPLVVREWDAGPEGTRYQILSGETRWRAAQSIEWQTIACRVVEGPCDDARALDLLALYNGQRTDLNPIEKAQLVDALCKNGRTREQAAREVGLQHAASASNLVRLLELPQVWQDRVAAGELPESFARLLVPLAKAPELLKPLEHEWKDHRRGVTEGSVPYEDMFRSRAELEEAIEALIDDETRQLDEALFTMDDKIREKLAVINVSVHRWEGGKRQLVMYPAATNCKLFDELQEKSHAQETKQNAGKSADADEKKLAKKKALTPAQQREKDKERAEQLANRINAWRHRWLCSLVADRLISCDPAMLAFANWLMVSGAFHDRELGKAAIENLGGKVRDAWEPTDDKLWKLLLSHDSQALDANEPQFSALLAMCKFALDQVDKDPKYLKLKDVIDDLARWCEVELDTQWNVLQVTKESDARLEEFLLLHSSDQLDALGKELGVYVEGQKTKAAKVQAILSAPRTLPIPQSIRPVANAKQEAPKKKPTSKKKK